MEDSENYYLTQEFRDRVEEFERAYDAGEPMEEFDVEDVMTFIDYYKKRGETRHAQELLDFAIRAFGHESSVPYITKAHELLAKGDIEGAEHYASFVEDTDDPDYRCLEISLLLAHDKVEEAAQYLKDYEKEVLEEDEDEDMDPFYLDAASIYLDYELIDEAIEWLERVNDKSSVDYRDQYGRVYFGRAEYKECARIYEELANEYPFEAFYWHMLAMTYFNDKQYDEALRCVEYVIAIQPASTEALFTKAKCLYGLGRFDEAMEYCNRYADAMNNP